MEDGAIVELYWQRSEAAIRETDRKYGRYLGKIAFNILENTEDSGECVNDTYLRVWNCVPPKKPTAFSAFLAKITRNLALSLYRRKHAEKREQSEFCLSLSELEECIPAALQGVPAEEAELNLLGEVISRYLRGISREAREMFVCRYFFGDSVKKIAGARGITEAKVKSSLHRTRAGLKEYLEKEGFPV
ncbi:MAG: RNA polymerase sigma factor [Ruminiclostridium sp.]